MRGSDRPSFLRAGYRLRAEKDRDRFDGFSDDETLRTQPMWDGSQSWAVPLLSTEFPVGAPARATGIDLRGYQRIRLVVSVGIAGGLADTVLSLRYSVDGGDSWADSGAELALTGAGNETNWGGWADIPDTLRQSIDVQLAVRQQRQRLDLDDHHQRRPAAAAAGAAGGEAGGQRNRAAQLQPAGHRRHRTRGDAGANHPDRHQLYAGAHRQPLLVECANPRHSL